MMPEAISSAGPLLQRGLWSPVSDSRNSKLHLVLLGQIVTRGCQPDILIERPVDADQRSPRPVSHCIPLFESKFDTSCTTARRSKFKALRDLNPRTARHTRPSPSGERGVDLL